MLITTVREFLNALRAGKYAWPGGYPRFFVTADGEALSFDAAVSEVWTIARAIRDGYEKQWIVAGVDVNWEEPNMYCAHTGVRIESAYAEPEPAR